MFTALIDLEEMGGEYDFFSSSPPVFPDLLKETLYPPLVISGNQLVWGFHLLSEAKRYGLRELNVRDIPGTPLELLKIALQLEGRRDLYTWEEMGKIAEFIEKQSITEDIGDVESYIRSSGGFLNHARQYLSLSPGCRMLVNSGNLDLKTASALVNFTDELCGLIMPLIAGYTFSERKKIIILLNEIGLRDGLDGAKLTRLLRNAFSADFPLSTLEKLRYPLLSDLENKMELFRNAYLKGTGLEVKAPPFFEGDQFSLSFKFRSTKELRKKLKDLERLAERTDELFHLLF